MCFVWGAMFVLRKSSSDDLRCVITSLPTIGSLFQVSPNYVNLGLLPARGIPITTVPCNVSFAGPPTANVKVVYAAPINTMTADRFTYTVYDASDNTQSVSGGMVDITASSSITGNILNNEIVSSPFHLNADGWTIESAASNAATFSPTSSGLLNHYIYGGDNLPSVIGVNNNVLWNFGASPSKWTGKSYINAFGGTLV